MPAKAMTKSDLMQKVAAHHHDVSMADIERAVNAVFSEMTHALVEGYRIELRGFGAFSVRQRNPRMGRNPKTGEAVSVPGKRVPFFKCGKILRERVDH